MGAILDMVPTKTSQKGLHFQLQLLEAPGPA